MARFWWALTALVLIGCAQVQTDPRRAFWGFKCDPRVEGWQYCEARNRGWGQL